MDLIKILLIGIIGIMVIVPMLFNAFTNPVQYISTQGNNATFTNTTPIYYPAIYVTIFSLVALLVILGLFIYVWGQTGVSKTGIKI